MAEVQTRSVQQQQQQRQQPTEKREEETKAEKKVEEGIPPRYSYGANALYNKKMGGFLHGKLVTLNTNELVRDALTALSVRGLTAAPVWDEEKSKYVKYIDMLDLLSYLISMTGKEVPKTGTSLNFSREDTERLQNKREDFLNTKIGDIAGLAGRDDVILMREDQTLGEAIEQYLKGVHRVLITDSEGNLLGVVSQSTVAKYIEDNIHRIKYDPCFQGTIWDFPYKTTSVKVVNRDTMVLDAFVQMRENNLTAVGVVDDQGKLVGNLSAADLQTLHIINLNFKHLSWTVGRFLRSIRRSQGRAPDFVICAPRDTPVLQLLAMFKRNYVHRIYIIDENNVPSGVISLTDIMRGLSIDMHKGHYQGPEVYGKGSVPTTTETASTGFIPGKDVSGSAEKQTAFESS